MRLLALDLGMHTGWALFRDGEREGSGVWRLDSDRSRDRGDLFLLLVQSLVQSHGIKVIAHEHVAALHQHASADAAHLFGGWLMLLSIIGRRATARVHRVVAPAVYAASGVRPDRRPAPRSMSEAERRRFSAERRIRNKAAQVAAARIVWGDLITDDNEADALFVGLASLAEGSGS
jgi:hypothetical protein